MRANSQQQRSALRQPRTLLLVLIWLILLLNTGTFEASKLCGSETLFDNLDVLDGWVHDAWFTPSGSDQRFAQQFLMGDNTMLDRVAVELRRVGSVTGSLSFELWRDDGSDRPMLPNDADAKIADIGTIPDVTELPRTASTYVFEDLATQLPAEEKYWVVANFSQLNIRGGNNSIGWINPIYPIVPGYPQVGPMPEEYRETQGKLGTGGAANAHLYKDSDPRWVDGGVWAGPAVQQFYFLMAVEGSRGSLLGDIDGDGVLGVADIETLSTAIAEMSTDAQFDLNSDGTVDLADRIHWIKELRNTWLGDANLDGEFNSSDLIVALAAGTYEADIDAGWAFGDFDGSGRFDSGDLILALADGGYEGGPRPAAVPEPSGVALVLVATVALARRLRFVVV